MSKMAHEFDRVVSDDKWDGIHSIIINYNPEYGYRVKINNKWYGYLNVPNAKVAVYHALFKYRKEEKYDRPIQGNRQVNR